MYMGATVRTAAAPTPVRKTSVSTARPPAAGTGTGIFSGLQSLLQTATQQVGPALQIYNQQRLATENLRRIREGLQPISYNDVPGLVPTVQVEGGLNEGTQRTTMLIFGGLAALAVFAMLQNKPKKR